jgi:type IV pilus assembly protein PilX
MPRRAAQRGMVLFISLILLLVLTILGVSLARLQTVNERLAQNDANHQLALETAEAALGAAYDDDADGMFSIGSGMPGIAALAVEIGPPATDLAYHADWSSPGTDTIVYTNNGAPFAAPAASQPQFVLEELPPQPPPGCQAGNINYNTPTMFTHRITAHAAGGDGTASATVQIIHYGEC